MVEMSIGSILEPVPKTCIVQKNTGTRSDQPGTGFYQGLLEWWLFFYQF
jgi:hypothetical protein